MEEAFGQLKKKEKETLTQLTIWILFKFLSEL